MCHLAAKRPRALQMLCHDDANLRKLHMLECVQRCCPAIGYRAQLAVVKRAARLHHRFGKPVYPACGWWNNVLGNPVRPDEFVEAHGAALAQVQERLLRGALGIAVCASRLADLIVL